MMKSRTEASQKKGGYRIGRKRTAVKRTVEKRTTERRTAEKRTQNSGMPDYGKYVFTSMQLLTQIGLYLLLIIAISYLFYRNILFAVLFTPGLPLFLKERKIEYKRRRDERICNQFLTGMQLVSTALQSGYAVENAFREALSELRKIYEEDTFIITEFRHITTQVRLNMTIEALLINLGERSHMEDIENFAEVFLAAKRTGGDLMLVIRNTVSCMRQKEETLAEIETVLAGKKMEQNVMSVIPMAILVYISITSPESLNGLYHTTTGILIMSFCLLLYLAAYLWGKKIMTFHV